MALSRTQIVDEAYTTLCEQGLGGLSMRRVAQELGVQPGALYYHVASKQDLLADVGARILAGAPLSTTDARGAAADLRSALLRVRDGAEVVSFVLAYRPEALGPCLELYRLFVDRFPPRHAEWAARTLVHYVLGFVAEEQNRAELVRTDILDEDPERAADAAEAFEFGVDAILRGLGTAGPPAR
ncbi:MAG: TetR family transcriptional regulator [Pseudonocardia sp.]|nr:TetR family transcriptional regulator [Pseudonocardia sp.]